LKSVFSTSYFPSISYLRALCEEENAIVDLGAQCKKQTERTRTNILTANGIHKLSVPIIRPYGNKTATKDIRISYVESWQRDHCRAIKTAYSSSPYYEDYSEQVFELINSDYELLYEFNNQILIQISRWLDLPIQIVFESKYVDNPNKDFREFEFQCKDKEYIQVDFGQNDFVPNLSILDALFCLGPMARKLIIP
jgi:hypothetical protein